MVDLVEASESGDRVETLRALRDILSRQITGTDSGRDVAALAARLVDVLAEIDELAPAAPVKGNPLDELKERRAARGAAPARKPRSTVGG